MKDILKLIRDILKLLRDIIRLFQPLLDYTSRLFQKIQKLNKSLKIVLTSVAVAGVLLIVCLILLKDKVEPEELFSVIKGQQEQYVKKSYGYNSVECFTEEDYRIFTESRIIGKIKENLRRNSFFIDAVKSAKSLSAAERNNLFDKAKKIYRPTFTELENRIRAEEKGNGSETAGKIEQAVKSGAGQTVFGQKAEKEIAETVTDLAISLCANN